MRLSELKELRSVLTSELSNVKREIMEREHRIWRRISVKCPECGGSGRYCQEDGYGRQFFDCDDCEGNGRVTKENAKKIIAKRKYRDKKNSVNITRDKK